MVTILPPAPSARWFSAFLSHLGQGFSEKEAISMANESLVSCKDFARISILDTSGNLHLLSMAVEGGGRQLRNPDAIESLQLSDHGDWRRIHLGAFEACLGSLPFYRHIEEDFKQVYSDKSVSSLRDFNAAIFNILKTFLLENVNPDFLATASANETLIDRGREISRGINPEISSLQAIAKYGRESLLGILNLEGVVRV